MFNSKSNKFTLDLPFGGRPTCGHVRDMGHGEILCDLVEGVGNNKACYLQTGMECGLNRTEPVRIEE